MILVEKAKFKPSLSFVFGKIVKISQIIMCPEHNALSSIRNKINTVRSAATFLIMYLTSIS